MNRARSRGIVCVGGGGGPQGWPIRGPRDPGILSIDIGLVGIVLSLHQINRICYKN